MNENITILQMQCFCAVAKYNNFSRAAEALYMSVSSVSKQVTAMETNCGFALLIRHGKNSELTDSGHHVLSDCNRTLREYNKLMKLINSLQKRADDVLPPIYFYGNPIMTDYGIIKSLNCFEKFNDDTKIQIFEAEDEYARMALLNNECDLAYMTNIDLDTSVFKFQKYCSDSLIVIVSNSSQYAHLDKINISDLKGKKLIGIQRESIFFNYIVQNCQYHGFIPKFVLLTSKLDMAREYLEDHVDAMLISPKRPFTNISLDDFKMLNLSNSLEFDFGFAWKRNRMLPDDVKKYLEFMKNREASEFML